MFTQILFVCTGNTCRSPMAAALTRTKLHEQKLQWSVQSAGLYAVPGMPMTPLAIDALTRRHIPNIRHAAQPVTAKLVSASDIILTMTKSQAKELQQRFPEAKVKIHPLMGYVYHQPLAPAENSPAGQDVNSPAVSVGSQAAMPNIEDISDPYGGSDEHYETCASVLDAAVENMIKKLKSSAAEA